MKTIVINGKKYKLLPYQEEEEELPAKGERKENILEDYAPEERKGEIKRAVGRLSDYRERFKKRKLSPAELMARPATIAQLRQDGSLDKFEYKGDKLFFGDGVVREY